MRLVIGRYRHSARAADFHHDATEEIRLLRCWLSFSATASAWCGNCRSGSITANSSPPIRGSYPNAADVPEAEGHLLEQIVPYGCPSVSLMSLNRSRSIKIKPHGFRSPRSPPSPGPSAPARGHGSAVRSARHGSLGARGVRLAGQGTDAPTTSRKSTAQKTNRPTARNSMMDRVSAPASAVVGPSGVYESTTPADRSPGCDRTPVAQEQAAIPDQALFQRHPGTPGQCLSLGHPSESREETRSSGSHSADRQRCEPPITMPLARTASRPRHRCWRPHAGR